MHVYGVAAFTGNERAGTRTSCDSCVAMISRERPVVVGTKCFIECMVATFKLSMTDFFELLEAAIFIQCYFQYSRDCESQIEQD